MTRNDYVHPDSGRVYREDDPAQRFAILAASLKRQCEDFLYHYESRLEGRDYLQQHVVWPSGPDRIARTMAHTLAKLDQAFTDVTVDKHLHRYGLGRQDDD